MNNKLKQDKNQRNKYDFLTYIGYCKMENWHNEMYKIPVMFMILYLLLKNTFKEKYLYNTKTINLINFKIIISLHIFNV